MKNTLARILACLLILTTVLTLPAVLPEESGAASVAEAASVYLNKTSATIYAGKTVTLKLNGTSKTVTWSSSNTKVATVSSAGKVKGIKAGTATITAKVGTKKYTCAVKVKSPLSVDTTAVTFTTQASKTVNVTFKLTGTVYAKSADTDMVTCKLVDGDSSTAKKLKIYAKRPGTTTITVSNSRSKDVKKITVTVKKISGNIQGIVGKSISRIRYRMADVLKPKDGYYMNSYLTVSLDGSKIDVITIWQGSKYKLYGFYPGMTLSAANELLSKDGWEYWYTQSDGDKNYQKGSSTIRLTINKKTKTITAVTGV